MKNTLLLFLCTFSFTLSFAKDTTVTFTKTYSVADVGPTRDASFSGTRETQAASVGDLDGDGEDEILVAGVSGVGGKCDPDCSLLFLSKTKTTKPFSTSYSVSVVGLSSGIQIVILAGESSNEERPDKTVKIYRILSRTEFPGEFISPEARLQLWQELNTGPSATFKRIGELEIIGVANKSLKPVPGSNPKKGMEYNVAIWKYTGSTSDSEPFVPIHWLNTTGSKSDRESRWIDFQVLGKGHEIRAIVVGNSRVKDKVGFFRFNSNMKLLSDKFYSLSDELLFANIIRVEACTVMIGTKDGARIYEYNPKSDTYELHYEDSIETEDVWCKMINDKAIFFMVRPEKQTIDVFEHYDAKNGELVIKEITISLDVPSKPLYATIESFVVNQLESVRLILTHDLGAEVYQISVD